MSDLRARLLALLRDGDSYGLELLERLAPGASWWRRVLDRANIYPTLRRMEFDGLLTSYEGPPLAIRGGRPRRYYRVTREPWWVHR